MTINTKAVVNYFENFLKKVGERKGTLLNIHSGEGESATLYTEPTYEVTQLDASGADESWPFADQQFDLVIDIFGYKHQNAEEQKAAYRRELKRVMKDDGLYLLSFAADLDGKTPTREELEREFFPSFVLVDYSEGPESGPSYIIRKNTEILSS